MRRARRHRNGKHAASWKSAAFAGVAAAASLGFAARDADAAVYCDVDAARQHQVQTSTRKSYVGLQPCFETASNKRIRPVIKWSNKRGGLGCGITIYPPGVGCSIDAWRPEVDFNGIHLSMSMSGAASRNSTCPIDVGDVNSHNDYEFTCYSSAWYSALGEYRTSGYTEFDVKDDGNDWFVFSSGTMKRNNK